MGDREFRDRNAVSKKAQYAALLARSKAGGGLKRTEQFELVTQARYRVRAKEYIFCAAHIGAFTIAGAQLFEVASY